MNLKKSPPALRSFGIIASWALVAACMAVIYKLSAQVAEDSVNTSMSVFWLLIDKFGYIIGHETLRSLAHALEYCGLAALVFHASIWSAGYALPRFAFLFAAVYAVTDEIHQHFVPGRAFQLTDILVDSCGALVGVLVCTLLYMAAVAMLQRRKAKKFFASHAIEH